MLPSIELSPATLDAAAGSGRVGVALPAGVAASAGLHARVVQGALVLLLPVLDGAVSLPLEALVPGRVTVTLVDVADDGSGQETQIGRGHVVVLRPDVHHAVNLGGDAFLSSQGVQYAASVPYGGETELISKTASQMPPHGVRGTGDGELFLSLLTTKGDEWVGFRSLDLEIDASGGKVLTLEFCELVVPAHTRTIDIFLNDVLVREGFQITGWFEAHRVELDVAEVQRPLRVSLRTSHRLGHPAPTLSAVVLTDTSLPNDWTRGAEQQTRSPAGDRVPSLLALCLDYISTRISSLDGMPPEVSDVLYDYLAASGRVLATNPRLLRMGDVAVPRPNLLKNGGCEAGDHRDWTITAAGGDGFGICEGFAGTHLAFSTSWNSCAREQTVDLATHGFTAALMDASPRPPIAVSETVAAGSCGGGKYGMRVELLSAESDEPLAVFAPAATIVFDRGDATGVQTVAHEFRDYPAGVRRVRFTEWGCDTRGWKGHYGVRLGPARVVVLANPASAPESLLAGPAQAASMLPAPTDVFAMENSFDLESYGLAEMHRAGDLPGLRDALGQPDLVVAAVSQGDLPMLLKLWRLVAGHAGQGAAQYSSLDTSASEELAVATAQFCVAAGRPEIALRILEDQPTPRSFDVLLELGHVHCRMGEFASANAELRAALALVPHIVDPLDAYKAAMALNALACTWASQELRTLRQAEVMLRRALDLLRKVLPAGHLDTAAVFHNLAKLSLVVGNRGAAEFYLLQEQRVLAKEDRWSEDLARSAHLLCQLYPMLSDECANRAQRVLAAV